MCCWHEARTRVKHEVSSSRRSVRHRGAIPARRRELIIPSCPTSTAAAAAIGLLVLLAGPPDVDPGIEVGRAVHLRRGKRGRVNGVTCTLRSGVGGGRGASKSPTRTTRCRWPLSHQCHSTSPAACAHGKWNDLREQMKQPADAPFLPQMWLRKDGEGRMGRRLEPS